MKRKKSMNLELGIKGRGGRWGAISRARVGSGPSSTSKKQNRVPCLRAKEEQGEHVG